MVHSNLVAPAFTLVPSSHCVYNLHPCIKYAWEWVEWRHAPHAVWSVVQQTRQRNSMVADPLYICPQVVHNMITNASGSELSFVG